MTNKQKLKKLGVKNVPDGYARVWLCCKRCKSVYYHDYIPFGIGRPVTWLPCGHTDNIGIYSSADVISESKAIPLLAKQLKKS